MSIKLTYVYDYLDLKKVIDFLQDGFNWSIKRSNEIKQHFNNQISTVPIAAYLEENGKLKIAILIFNQSKYLDNSAATLNFSSWYASPDSRGIIAINFARKLVKDLKNFTLTNYTASPHAYKIFKNLEFEDMKVKKIQFGFIGKFPFLKFVKLSDFIYYKFSKNIKFRSISNEIIPENIKNLVIHFNLRKVRIKKKFFKLKIADFYIDEKVEGKISFWTLLYFSLRHLCIQINIFIKSDIQAKKSGWLVKNSKLPGQYISPSNSELCIKTGIEKL